MHELPEGELSEKRQYLQQGRRLIVDTGLRLAGLIGMTDLITSRKHSLHRRLLIIMLCLTSVPILISGLMVTWTGQRTVKQTVTYGNIQVAARAARHIESYVESAKSMLRGCAGVIAASPMDPWRQQLLLRNLSIHFTAFNDLTLYDVSGKALAISNLDESTVSPQNAEMIEAALKGREAMSSVYMNSYQVPCVTIAVPITRLGNNAGLLLAEVTLCDMWDLIDSIKLGHTGRALVTDKYGCLIAHRDTRRVLKRIHMHGFEAASVAGKGKGAYEALDESGVATLSAYAYIPSLGWTVAVQQNMAEAYAAAYRIRRLAIWTLVLSILLTYMTGMGQARSITKPLLALVSSIKVLGTGRFEERVQVQGEDEIAELAGTFNEMSGKLEDFYTEIISIKRYNENILAGMTSGVMVVNPGGSIITFNNAASVITGITIRRAQGTHIERFKVLSVFNDIIANAQQGRPCLGQEIELPGTNKIVTVHSSLMNPQSEQAGAVILVFNDITEIKEMERLALRREKLASIGEMTAGLSHEIRNSLNLINGYAAISMKMNGEISPYLSIVQDEAIHLSELTTSFLEFARDSSRRMVMADMQSVLSETIRLSEPRIKEKGIQLSKDYNELPEVNVDAVRLQRALLNVILNAIEATANGGEIRISAGTDNGWLYIAVADSGEGIPIDLRDKIFNPFFTTKKDGTGLGLSLAHKIISEHHGSIDLESEIDKGSKFTIRLPLKTEMTKEYMLIGNDKNSNS